MKLHRHLVFAVVQALKDIFDQGFYADKVIEYHLKRNKKWGSRDRRFFAESVYEMVRWWRLLWFLLSEEESLEEENLLRLFAVWLLHKGESLPDWPEFKNVKLKSTEPPSLAISESLPDWIHNLCVEQIGEEKWAKLLPALNRKANVVLRGNLLKADIVSIVKQLSAEGVEVEQVAAASEALQLKERKNVFITQAFKKGLFEVQDASSQGIAPLLMVEPGMRVVDACAGAGGKTLHLASLMQNRGRIIALDIHEHKLKELEKRARRAGVGCIETRTIKNNKTIKRLKESVDRVLLDVPCTGLGVLRRNPDTKWKLTAERLEEVKKIQSEILQNYSSMLKPGGRLVYSTCSVLPSENEKQVEKFLSANESQWKLVEEKKWWPDVDGFDGFYAAVIERV